VGKQQIAEVVTVEGAEQDGRGGHRRPAYFIFEGSAMVSPARMKAPWPRW
jgi:hypothetical protein